MATKEKETKAEYLPNIKPGTPEMETFLAAGYPDIGTKAHAKEIIAERKANPAMITWELAQRAEAYLAALDTQSIVIDPTPGKRDDIQT